MGAFRKMDDIIDMWIYIFVMYLLYLLEHPLGVGNAGGLLAAVPGPAGEVVAGGELVHGDHGGAGLLPAQLQHREQVQRHRAHVGQGPHLAVSSYTGVCRFLMHYNIVSILPQVKSFIFPL